MGSVKKPQGEKPNKSRKDYSELDNCKSVNDLKVWLKDNV